MCAHDDQISAILDKMEVYGGEFEKHLAKAFRHADDVNRSKILTAFNNYFAGYASTRIPVVK